MSMPSDAAVLTQAQAAAQIDPDDEIAHGQARHLKAPMGCAADALWEDGDC